MLFKRSFQISQPKYGLWGELNLSRSNRLPCSFFHHQTPTSFYFWRNNIRKNHSWVLKEWYLDNRPNPVLLFLTKKIKTWRQKRERGVLEQHIFIHSFPFSLNFPFSSLLISLLRIKDATSPCHCLIYILLTFCLYVSILP